MLVLQGGCGLYSSSTIIITTTAFTAVPDTHRSISTATAQRAQRRYPVLLGLTDDGISSNVDENDPDSFQAGLDDVLAALGGGISPPSKADMYSNDELMSILNVHQELTELRETNETKDTDKNVDSSNSEGTESSSVDEEQDSVFALHETVLRAMSEQVTDFGSTDDMVQSSFGMSSSSFAARDPILNVDNDDHDDEGQQSNNNNNKRDDDENSDGDWLDDDFKKKIANIRCIASDVDGTLLTSKHQLHPRTKLAVLESLKRVDRGELLQFFPATGKSRKGALDSLGREVGVALSTCPGVFLQGLYCVDGENNIVFEQKLSHTAVQATEDLVAQYGLSIVAYDGDDLYTTDKTASVVELHERYGEPLAEVVDSISALPDGVHKILLMDPSPEKLTDMVRQPLEELAKQNDSGVTQAIPTMLELLPSGCSKARGVREICRVLGVDPASELLALGDAENDVEMLQEASIGVAMGNACPVAQEAADFVMSETNNDGGAGAAIQVFGFGLY